MSVISQIKNRRALGSLPVVYERLLGAIGTDGFGATVRDSVLSLTKGARRLYLFEATAREHSSLQYFSGEPGLADLFPAYRRWYLPVDPVGDAFRTRWTATLLHSCAARKASPGFRQIGMRERHHFRAAILAVLKAFHESALPGQCCWTPAA